MLSQPGGTLLQHIKQYKSAKTTKAGMQPRTSKKRGADKMNYINHFLAQYNTREAGVV